MFWVTAAQCLLSFLCIMVIYYFCYFSYFPFSFRGQDFRFDCTSAWSLLTFCFMVSMLTDLNTHSLYKRVNVMKTHHQTQSDAVMSNNLARLGTCNCQIFKFQKLRKCLRKA